MEDWRRVGLELFEETRTYEFIKSFQFLQSSLNKVSKICYI